MIKNTQKQNPYIRMNTWHNDQTARSKATEDSRKKEKYELEVTRFNDSFESLSTSDGKAGVDQGFPELRHL